MVLMFTGAQAFLAAHAIIPSSVASHHLSARWLRLRPMMYAGGFACLAGVAAVFIYIIAVIGVGDLVHSIYPHLYR